MSIKFLLITFFAVVSMADVALCASRPATDKPNVIIFLLDDSGYGDYSHNGNPTIQTQNISKMANEGVNFTQFYTSSPACTASRYSLLTGRVPGRSGFHKWVVGPDGQRYLHTSEITLAEGLRAQGYKTGMFGKWHLGSPNKANSFSTDSLPLAHGFDEWIGTNVSHDFDNSMLIRSDEEGTTPVNGYHVIAKELPFDTAASTSLTKLYTDSAVDFINKNANQPFFAYIAYNQPHLGLFVNEQFKGQSRRGLLGDVMMEIDASVGRILQTLEKQEIDKNTLIIFTSDNGPWIKFQDTKRHKKYGDEVRMQVGYALPFRDGKGSNWEGGHRVPGIFYWPGILKARTQQEPASTMDIMPTLFKLANVSPIQDRTIDGRDILPLVMDVEPAQNVNPFSLVYSDRDNKPAAIRIDEWKLHVRISSQTDNNYGFDASEESPLLFQIEQDISERIDRSSENPELRNSMLVELAAQARQIEEEGSFWD